MKADLLQPKVRQPTFFGNRRMGTFLRLSCGCCNSIIKSSKGHNIKLQHFSTCTTLGVIYMLICPFGKAYVGKTKRGVRMRIGEHKRTITNCDLETQKYVTPVSRHFRQQGHNSNQ
ncbi:hypothetical protein XELAEV_18017054mg [Xenopus laevis]|uniref:GIY-YIG domain-containing protein n=1 Tax=Xenopus laevis TaxID=8355 RepID=A0A974DAW0_XENLA|nr:hypothetical protein XELAEV_18017054mg [Xenopus laevis]